ncbi:MAG: hypothetical protein H7Z37_17420 [Pyrinomonadaceae bacterium]|nr:hypothetical protein [Pyrinomonadaceae bacterium]
MDEETLKSRVTGLVLLCIGIVTTYGNHSMRENGDGYHLELAAFAPIMIGLALLLIIEAPKIPLNKPSVFGWFCLGGGFAFGFWNAFF